jgi:hypothetical protein
MSPENMSKLPEAVERYCQRHSISPAFEPSPLYHLQRDWHDKEFPNSRGPGCYIFYTENGDILYIGKASFRHSLGSRIVSYFRGGKPKDNWSSGGPRPSNGFVCRGLASALAGRVPDRHDPSAGQHGRQAA